MGSFCLQHGVTPLIRNHPIIGTFSYHFSGRPQAQCECPIILSPRFPLSITTLRKDEIEAPSMPPRIVIKIIYVVITFIVSYLSEFRNYRRTYVGFPHMACSEMYVPGTAASIIMFPPV